MSQTVSRRLVCACIAAPYLVEFQTNEASDQSSRGGNGGNDLASDLLRVVSVRRVDTIVDGTQVRSRGDKVDVMVGIVIFFELDRG